MNDLIGAQVVPTVVYEATVKDGNFLKEMQNMASHVSGMEKNWISAVHKMGSESRTMSADIEKMNRQMADAARISKNFASAPGSRLLLPGGSVGITRPESSGIIKANLYRDLTGAQNLTKGFIALPGGMLVPDSNHVVQSILQAHRNYYNPLGRNSRGQIQGGGFMGPMLPPGPPLPPDFHTFYGPGVGKSWWSRLAGFIPSFGGGGGMPPTGQGPSGAAGGGNPFGHGMGRLRVGFGLGGPTVTGGLGMSAAGGGMLASLGIAAAAVGIGLGIEAAFLGVGKIKHGLEEVVNLTYKAAEATVKLGVQYEKDAVSFGVLTGSMKEGQRVLEEIYQLAIASPFKFQELSQVGQMLLGLGVPNEEGGMIAVLGKLGDLATGDVLKLQRLALAYGQVTAAGRLRGEELRQFTNVGVGVGDFAKTYGKSVMEFRADMEAGLVPAAVVAKTINNLTSAGGRFANLNKQIAETVGGQWNQLVEKLELAGAKAGRVFFERFGVAAKVGVISDVFQDLQGQVEPFIASMERTGVIQQVWSDIRAVIKSVRETFGGLNLDNHKALDVYTSIRDVVIEIGRAMALAALYTGQMVKLMADMGAISIKMIAANPATKQLFGMPAVMDMMNLAKSMEALSATMSHEDFGKARDGIRDFFNALRRNTMGGLHDLSELEKQTLAVAEGYTKLAKLELPVHPGVQPGGLSDLLSKNLMEKETMREMAVSGVAGYLAGVANAFPQVDKAIEQSVKDYNEAMKSTDVVASMRQNARAGFAGVAADFAMELNKAVNKALGEEKKIKVKLEIAPESMQKAIDLAKSIKEGITPLEKYTYQMGLLREARFGPGTGELGEKFNMGIGAMAGALGVGYQLNASAIGQDKFKIGSFQEFDALRKSVQHSMEAKVPAMARDSVEAQDTMNRAIQQQTDTIVDILTVLTVSQAIQSATKTEIEKFNNAIEAMKGTPAKLIRLAD